MVTRDHATAHGPARARDTDLSHALAEAAKALTSTLRLNEVLEAIMRSVAQLLGPQNWSLLLMDRERQELYFEIVVGDAADAIKTMRLPVGEGIAGWVALHRQPLAVPCVADDPRFCGRMDQASKVQTQSILAAPLVFANEVLGVIELVALGDERRFAPDDLAQLMPFADFAAIAIENARAYERIRELTLTDEWTTLYNARFLRSCLTDEVGRASRYHHPVSVVFLDLDGFKQVNDTRGHAAGSAVLKQVADVLLAVVRNTDRSIRYGGDEFVVVMPETSKHGAMALAERIRQTAAERAFDAQDGGAPIRLTASLGVATYPDDASNASELLETADRAMYLGKTRGRNTVVDALGVPRDFAPDGPP